MVQVNLRDFFYWYRSDFYIEVTEEVAQELRAGRRDEYNFRRRMGRNGDGYYLDSEDEQICALSTNEPSPQELVDRKDRFIALWNALNSLPESQGRRVDACIIMGQSYAAIAQAEGIDESSVRKSVQRGLAAMKKSLKKFW